MKKILILLVILFLVQLGFGQKLEIEFPYIKNIEYEAGIQQNFARYGICQLQIPLTDTTKGLKTIKDAKKVKESILACIKKAIKNNVNVLIFPELSVAFNTKNRIEILDIMKETAKTHDIIIIAGSFYSEYRENIVPIILPTGIEYSYKIKPSKFEVSPIADEGMTRGDTLTVISSKYGKILPIVCVDLISDEIQFIARYLSNKNIINTLVNITYNPASQEFMREMSAAVKRHELFGIIANVAHPFKDIQMTCIDTCYGNSSIFATLFIQQKKTTKLISECFKDCKKKKLHPAYSTLISQVNPDIEGMIIIDLNLSTVRPPKRTNAPDQGYPTVKNLKIINLGE